MYTLCYDTEYQISLFLNAVDILWLTKVSKSIRKGYKKCRIWKMLLNRDFPYTKIIFDNDSSFINIYMKKITDAKVHIYSLHGNADRDVGCKLCQYPLCARVINWDKMRCIWCEGKLCENHFNKGVRTEDIRHDVCYACVYEEKEHERQMKEIRQTIIEELRYI